MTHRDCILTQKSGKTPAAAKTFYWIAQLTCDQTLGWEIAFLSWHLSIYLFREKGGKTLKGNQSGPQTWDNVHCRLTDVSSVVVTEDFIVQPRTRPKIPTPVDQLLCWLHSEHTDDGIRFLTSDHLIRKPQAAVISCCHWLSMSWLLVWINEWIK